MVLQVGAVRHRLPAALAEDRDALRGVEQTGRTALAEMRRLLGAMRDGDEDARARAPAGPRPARRARRGGRPRRAPRARCTSRATPSRSPRAIDLSAYRIVQEGLTNALKHARASHADVTVRYGADDAAARGRATTARAPRRATGAATGSSGSASASRSTAAR